MNLKIFLLIILDGICSTTEQILFKKGANNIKSHALRNIKDYILLIRDILKIPAVWLAFIMVITAWLIWFVVLASIDLSVAIPIASIQYILIMFASYFFLKERLHWTRVVGILFILLGVFLVAKS